MSKPALGAKKKIFAHAPSNKKTVSILYNLRCQYLKQRKEERKEGKREGGKAKYKNENWK